MESLERRNINWKQKTWSSGKWPLILRFSKENGSIHSDILLSVLFFGAWAAVVVYGTSSLQINVKLPTSIISSLSIVVGLELVFRNQTAYNRFWVGRVHFNTITTAVRCLSRHILCSVPSRARPRDQFGTGRYHSSKHSKHEELDLDTQYEPGLSEKDEAKTVETIKILVAMMYSVKNHLRAKWDIALSPGNGLTEDGQNTDNPEYKDLLPNRLKGHEHLGLGLTLQLTTFVENFIKIGIHQGWFPAPTCVQMLSQLNDFVAAYGSMEFVRLAHTPVAHLIHSKQILAVFCCILPFAMVAEIGWWTVPLSSFITFSLYGIEGIAQWHEDPFGVNNIDINMDDIVDDTKREIFVLLTAWQDRGQDGEALFS